jgi:hypothetical protein
MNVYTKTSRNWGAPSACRPVSLLECVDTDLITRARAGDSDAFRELTGPYRCELQVHCYRILESGSRWDYGRRTGVVDRARAPLLSGSVVPYPSPVRRGLSA